MCEKFQQHLQGYLNNHHYYCELCVLMRPTANSLFDTPVKCCCVRSMHLDLRSIKLRRNFLGLVFKDKHSNIYGMTSYQARNE